MLARLIEMIERNAGDMAENLKQRLLADPATSSFKVLDDRTLHESIFQIYSRLGYWLLRDSERGEVRSYYSNIGEQRFMEGFPLHEVIQAQVATKRHVWDTVLEKGIVGTAKELDAAVDLISLLNRFFDMAIYYTTLGYDRALGMKSMNQ